MTVLRKGELAAPVLPAETVDSQALGGEVIVQGLTLSARLALFGRLEQRPNALIPELLAVSIVDADRQPLFSVEEWDAWGAANGDATLALFNVARRLSGMDPETEKNG